MQKYSVKKPVFTFRDLEVYQKTMEASVVAVKILKTKLIQLKYPFTEGMMQCSMSIPLLIGEAHSIRFGDHPRAILLLEQARGIYGSKLDFNLVEDLIKKYTESRTKIFRLEKSWDKWIKPRG